jgi:hypothetical protein
MPVQIDGSYTLEELESAILHKEAAANEIITLDNNDDENDPQTLATFKKLGPGKRPKPIHLVGSTNTQPTNTKLVCSGTVYADGGKIVVSAYRDK